MNNGLFKDFIREIRGNMGRFMSIFFIVMLGAAFFAGIRSAGGDMRYTSDAYYDKTDMMDIRVLSTLGLTDKDINDISNVDQVECVVGGHTKEALVSSGEDQHAIKVIAETDNINKLTLKEGREPQNENECVIDTHLVTLMGYKIGDKIKLSSGDDAPLSDDLSVTEFEIVGTGYLPYYLDVERGTGSIGDGSIDGFIITCPDVFTSDIYTEAYVKVKGAKELNTYTDEYDKLVEETADKIEDISDEAGERRYQEIYTEANDKITDGEQKVADAENELNNAKKELDDGKARLDAAKAELETGEKQYEEGLAQYNSGYAQYQEGLKTFNEGKEQYEEGLTQYNSGKAEYDASVTEYEDGLQKYNDGYKEWEDGKKEYDDSYDEAVQKIDDAKAELQDARDELAGLEKAKWYVLDRDKISSCVSYGMDADRMDSLGNVFPVIFFLVAALVSLTAMTRMVEEQRQQIGTLKALGYSGLSIAGKYIGYAMLATVGGAVIGVIIGEIALPTVIISSYCMLYIGLPEYHIPADIMQGSLAIILSVLCTGIATIAACYKKIKDKPAELMRPEPPKSGRRIFLEHIGFIWKRLNFTQKSTLRNLFRYKKRFIMTIIGIGGCMALMLVGFGIRDSITVVAQNQYIEIFKQSATVGVDTSADESKLESLENRIKDYSDVTETLDVCELSVTLNANNTDRTAYLFVPKEADKISDFVRFRDRVSKKEYDLPKEGVTLSEKTATMLGVSVGDEITVKKSEDSEGAKVRVESIIENYVQHYAFISEDTYNRLFGEAPEYNYIYVKFDLNDDAGYEKQFGTDMMAETACTGVSFTSDLEDTITEMLKTLDLVIWVLIFSAALLAFVVLYNLNSINMTERKRELATLKVLGFYDTEVAMYVYRENIILTLIGIVVGAVLGSILHLFTILTVEVDLMMFGRVISPMSYAICAAITFAFSLIVNMVMYYNFKKINMVESLKSVE